MQNFWLDAAGGDAGGGGLLLIAAPPSDASPVRLLPPATAAARPEPPRHDSRADPSKSADAGSPDERGARSEALVARLGSVCLLWPDRSVT